MKIEYVICDEPLAAFLIAQDKNGLCAVWAGESAAELAKQFYHRFTDREHVETPSLKRTLLPAIYGVLSGGKKLHDLPVGLEGTEFQKKVWRALLKVPHGGTATYTEIAIAIGKPEAVRAVANACGDNPLGILVPCHRILRRDGSLGGYRWGLGIKRRLLDYERKASIVMSAVA